MLLMYMTPSSYQCSTLDMDENDLHSWPSHLIQICA
uniref:Uncharacterized protein n=1 Tax=Rhizophora mucronata TaxID=61149 RepID=A0A2P2PKZ3_RHIMU